LGLNRSSVALKKSADADASGSVAEEPAASNEAAPEEASYEAPAESAESSYQEPEQAPSED